MNKIKFLAAAVTAVMMGVMCSCLPVEDIVGEIESQINVIEDEINADSSSDDDYSDYTDDENNVLYPLPAALYAWDDEYVATFGEIEGYDYSDNYSEKTLLLYNSKEYGEGAICIYVSADKAEYMDGSAYEYYREDIDSFREYASDIPEYGEFIISDEKTVSAGDIEASYFDVYYPAYSNHFYETNAWIYVEEADAYVNISMEGFLSDNEKSYDSEEVIKAVISAMSIGGDDTVHNMAVPDETESFENNPIDAFR